jgi:ParB family transcriptional regulator, chromosome partitioning protein
MTDSTQMKDNGPRKALGRGLAALIPTANVTAAAPAMSAPSTANAGLRSLPIERIHPNRKQPRKNFEETALQELAASIREQGVLQPIVVRRRGDDYEIVAGERRWRAASRAGLHEVPALVKEFSDAEALQAALIENIQRADLDPLEEADAYSRLIRDHSLTQEEVAVAVGKNRATIANSLRLLKLPASVLPLLGEGKLTAGHARALMTLGSDHHIEKLAHDIVERRLSVRDAERLARQQQRAKPAKAEQRSPAESNVEERLQRALGTKVRLHHRRGRGRIEISFHSLDELDRLLDRLAP